MLSEVFPPGDYIREELETRNWSHAFFAEMIQCDEKELAALLSGELLLTNELAQRIALAFGTSIELWVNLERFYRERLAEKDSPHGVQDR